MAIKRRDVRMARRMFKQHKPQDQIVAALGAKHSWATIRTAILADESRAAVNSDRVRPTIVPPEVKTVRYERLMLRHATIIGHVSGDPLPGESALDRRRSTAAPSIVHDPLDDLVFGLSG